MAPASATTVAHPATTTATNVAAAALMSNGAVIEFRMMTDAMMMFPRMADGKDGIAPAPPTPVWRIAVFRVAVAIPIDRKTSARAGCDHSK
jgi:hypothetical protein